MKVSAKVLLVISLLFYCLDYFFRISPSLVLVPLMQQYQIDSLGVGMLQSAFYLGYLFFLIPAGLLLDHCRIEALLKAMILICCLCFIAFCFSHNFRLGLSLRFVTGLASGMSFIAVLTVAVRHFPSYFSIISGLAIGLGTLSASVMQSISASIMGTISWHWLYLFISGLGLLMLIPLSLGKFGDKVLTNKPEIAFKAIFHDIRQYLLNPLLLMNAVIGGLFYLPTSLFAGLWGISFMKFRFHVSSEGAALGIFLLFLGWAVGSPIVGAMADKYRHFTRIPLLASFLAAVLSFFMIVGISSTHLLMLSLFVFGLLSSGQVSVWKYYQRLANSRYRGLGIALTNMIIMFFGACFHTVVGYFVDLNTQSLAQLNHAQVVHHFQTGLMIIPMSFLVSSLLLLGLNYLLKHRFKDAELLLVCL